jgi:D-alanyl-D-alanine carboxypeptidase
MTDPSHIAFDPRQLSTAAETLFDEQTNETLLARVDVGGVLQWQCALTKSGAALDPDIAFPIYSVTKTFLAALVAILVERGRLTFDQRLMDIFPEIQIPGGEQITLRHLLRNESGIRDYGPLPSYKHAVRSAPATPWGESRFLAETLPLGLAFVPERGWEYSNTNFLLLKKVIEKYYQASFAEVVQLEICKPLGLTHTVVMETFASSTNLLPGYSGLFSASADGELVDVRSCYNPGWVAHGLIASSTGECNRFLYQLLSGQFIKSVILNDLMESVAVPHTHPYFRKPSYALGLMCDPDFPLGPIYGHNGSGPGYSVSAFALPRDGLCISVCSNSDDYLAEGVLFELLMNIGK